VSRPLDFSALTRAERGVLLSGSLGLLNGLMPWWYRTNTAAGTFLYPASLRPLSLLAVTCCALAAVIALVRAWIWPEPAPSKDGLVYAALGALATGALLIELVTGTAPWVGIGLGLLLAAGLATAGVRRRQERTAGWS
jgi:hypothetical protein